MSGLDNHLVKLLWGNLEKWSIIVIELGEKVIFLLPSDCLFFLPLKSNESLWIKKIENHLVRVVFAM